jgi:phosphomannomutase
MAVLVGEFGIRGRLGQALTLDQMSRLGAAFSLWVHERLGPVPLVVGRDSRSLSRQAMQAFLRGLGLFPHRVLPVGLVPTPAIPLAMQAWAAMAGAVVTAGAAPPGWSGLKLYWGSPPLPLTVADLGQILESAARLHSLPRARPALTPPPEEATALHVEQILARVEQRGPALKVALDAARGSAEEPLRHLLTEMSCEVRVVECFGEGEPTPRRLGDLSAMVVDRACDLGVATDLDGDRLALVDHRGKVVGMDATAALALSALLERPGAGPVLLQNTASSLLAKVAGPAGQVLGEETAFLCRRAQKAGARAVLTEGGLIWPEVGWGRDALAMAALVIEFLRRRRASLEEAARALPPWTVRRSRLPWRSLQEAGARVRLILPEARVERGAAEGSAGSGPGPERELSPGERETAGGGRPWEPGLEMALPDGCRICLWPAPDRPGWALLAEGPRPEVVDTLVERLRQGLTTSRDPEGAATPRLGKADEPRAG